MVETSEKSRLDVRCLPIPMSLVINTHQLNSQEDNNETSEFGPTMLIFTLSITS